MGAINITRTCEEDVISLLQSGVLWDNGVQKWKKLNHFFPLVLISNLNFRISTSKVSFNLPDLRCQIFSNVVLKAKKYSKFYLGMRQLNRL